MWFLDQSCDSCLRNTLGHLLGNLKYQEIYFSNPIRKAKVSQSLVRSTIVTHTPTISISTPIVRSQLRIPSTHINRFLDYIAYAFATFNVGSPLLLAQRNELPISDLKMIPPLLSIFMKCQMSTIFIES